MANISVDAREVLAQLNSMGYTNITAEQLKEFIKDLKKLIKYEHKIGVYKSHENKEKEYRAVFEKLHRKPTVSTQAKYSEKDTSTKPLRESNKIGTIKCPVHKSNENIQREAEPIRKRKTTITEPKTTTSDRRTTTGTKVQKTKPDDKENPNPMWIRPRKIITHPAGHKGPAELYQYYKREWEKFKPQLPGENDHTELRWAIRHKLLGDNC